MRTRRTLAVAIVLMSSSLLMAQVATGAPPFASMQTGTFDAVDLGNLNAQFKIPVVNKAGRGVPFFYNLAYDTSIWYPAVVNGTNTWQPVGNWGWHADTEMEFGYLSSHTYSISCQWMDDLGRWHTGTDWITNNYKYHDAMGVAHPVGLFIESGPCNTSETDTATTRDGSGVTADIGGTITFRNGKIVGGTSSATDTNGNEVTFANNVFTDTLGNTALTLAGSGTPSSPKQFQYTAPSGATASVTMNYSSYNVLTPFGCSGVSEYSASGVNLVSSITLPDSTSYTFTYEPTPGHSGYYTGRIQSITLPTGGQISYTYTGGANDGIVCSDGSTNTLGRQTPDGTWTYARSLVSGSQWQTTITDPANNQTTIQFQQGLELGKPTQNFYETERDISSPAVETIYTCYNGATIPCNSTSVSHPITQRTVILKWPSGLESQTKTVYNSTSGVVTEVDEYDYGSGAPGPLVRQTLTNYATLTGILDHPSQITVKDSNGTIKAQTTLTYDQGTVTATSGTPQHVAVSGSRGNLTTVSQWVQGSTTLSKTFSYYDTGTVKQATDVNGAATTFSYNTPNCPNSFVTSLSLPLSLTRSMVWNCTGAVATSATDENNKTASTSYTDQYFWRPASTTDPLSNITSFIYISATQVSSSMSFNSGSSMVENLGTLDGLGRAKVGQRRQGPGASNYDSVTTTYDSLGRQNLFSMPYSGSGGQTSTSPATTTSYDALGRPTQVTDAGGGTVSNTYTQNDVLTSVGPAPTGENTKRRQLEYDGLGRLTSVCELTSTGNGGGTCGQTSAQTGFWTRYTYDVLGNLLTVSQNAQSASPQGRSYTYDGLGRLTSETNPENGTTSYYYDSDTSGLTPPCAASSGDLVRRVDAVGNSTCYSYDTLHRLTSITYPSGSYSANTPSKTFVYDVSTASGFTLANTKGRLAEAYTGPSGSKITDLVFSYSARGEVTDAWESTPHSGGYYHVTGSYWANGALNTLGGLGLPTFTYGVDGEGRPNAVTASSGTNPVPASPGTAYNVAGEVTGLTLGSGDSDSFTFDANTLRMTQYKHTVGATPQNVVGNLTWNANGTLGTLAITDPFNSANQQTCSYSYDDLARLSGANCGSAWAQTFGYDPFGNLNKTGSVSFQPTYNTATNRVGTVGGQAFSYDANGNTLNDTLRSYLWDSEGHAITIGSVSGTFDALGRMVEQYNGSVYTQIVYGLTGSKLALMNGQTVSKAFVPLPAGAVAVYSGTTLSYFRHPDWLGSVRLASTPTQTVHSDLAYAPFGETYAESGTPDRSFTGQNQDTVANSTTGLYDFLLREHAQYGRWISPDPAGTAAVNGANPQSWNRYAYALNDPLRYVDPLGLKVIVDCHGWTEGAIVCSFFVYPTGPFYPVVDWFGGGGSGKGTKPPANNGPCNGETKQLGNNVILQSNAQGTFTATVPLTGSQEYTADLSSGSVTVPPNTSLTLTYNGALTISANNPIYYSTGLSGLYGGAYFTSITYDSSSNSYSNAGFTQVNGTRAIFGIPLSSSKTPSAFLLNQLNQNSSLSNTAALLEAMVHSGQTLTNLDRLIAGCKIATTGSQ